MKNSGLNADGLATIPASSAAWQGASTDAQDGRGASPQPAVAPVAEIAFRPRVLPKYTRAADSTP